MFESVQATTAHHRIPFAAATGIALRHRETAASESMPQAAWHWLAASLMWTTWVPSNRRTMP